MTNGSPRMHSVGDETGKSFPNDQDRTNLLITGWERCRREVNQIQPP